MAIVTDRQGALLDVGQERLEALLGPAFQISVQPDSAGSVEGRRDRGLEVRDTRGGTCTTLLLEAHTSPTPSRVREQYAAAAQLLRRVAPNIVPVLVAPYLSPQTRAALTDIGYGYLDEAGNVSLDVQHPRVRLLLEGTGRPPVERPTGERGLSGAAAGRLVRVLADIPPPYNTSQLAAAAALSLGYTSRLLEVCQDRGLLARRRGQVTDCDWAELLRARAAAVPDLMRGRTVRALAVAGEDATIARLAQASLTGTVAVTGSYAANQVVPLVGRGDPLMLWVDPSEVDAILRGVGALRSDDGDLLCLLAPDGGVFTRSRTVEGVPYAALSQLVLDCLTGPSRMPAHGEALLTWMQANEASWRQAAGSATVSGRRAPSPAVATVQES